jgi:uncharacterized protein YggE
MVSSKVTDTIKMKKSKAPISRIALKVFSHFNAMKYAATRYALQAAIAKAERMSSGLGRPKDDTTTVKIVRMKSPVPIAQSILAAAI